MKQPTLTLETRFSIPRCIDSMYKLFYPRGGAEFCKTYAVLREVILNPATPRTAFGDLTPEVLERARQLRELYANQTARRN